MRQERKKKKTRLLHWPEKKIWHALCGSREQQSVESQVQHTSDCETTNWSRGSKKGHSSIRRGGTCLLSAAPDSHTRVTPSVHETAETLPTQSVLSPSSGGGQLGETTRRPRLHNTRQGVPFPCPLTVRNLTEREKHAATRKHSYPMQNKPEQQTPSLWPRAVAFSKGGGTHTRD